MRIFKSKALLIWLLMMTGWIAINLIIGITIALVINLATASDVFFGMAMLPLFLLLFIWIGSKGRKTDEKIKKVPHSDVVFYLGKDALDNFENKAKIKTQKILYVASWCFLAFIITFVVAIIFIVVI